MLSYQVCCAPFHRGQAHASNAAALMRSRYSAYVLRLIDYLRATWHPDFCPATLPPDQPQLRWLGLQVKRHQQIDDRHAIVEFVARYKIGGRAERIHEVSEFVYQNGRWLYTRART
jgi:SEC-C motif domain protein